jgi:hypothetical protein
MTLSGWLARAKLPNVGCAIKTYGSYDNFQAMIRVAGSRSTLNWDEALALLHIVYAWMPTMLRLKGFHDQKQRAELLAILCKARKKGELSDNELALIVQFANRSVVGASKLLHILSPNSFAIWDSRVAEVFLWGGVTRPTYEKVARYQKYMETIRQWALTPCVKGECCRLRALNSAFAEASDLRMIELVMFVEA